MMNTQRLADGVAVVTGAAGSMGKATANALFEAGWNELLLCDLDAAKLEAVAEPLRNSGADVSIYSSDIATAGYSAGLIDALRGRLISAFVHMAGIGPHQGDPVRGIDVNLGATTRLVEAIRDHLAAGSAAILIASNSAYFPKRPEAVEAFCRPFPAREAEVLVSLAPTPEEAYPLSKLGILALVKREAKSPQFPPGSHGAKGDAIGY